MRRHRLTLLVLLLAGSAAVAVACSGGDGDAGPPTSGTESTSTESTSTTDTAVTAVPVTEIVSPEVQPTVVDVPTDSVPPAPDVPTDSFAIGDETPRDPKGRPFLSQGDKGDDVVALQRRLIDLKFPLDDSGVFDDATLAAVLTFQRSQGLVADGVVGTKTYRALDNPRAPSPTTTVSAAVTGDAATLPSLDPPKNDPAQQSSGKVTGAIIVLGSQKVVLFSGSKPVKEFPVSSGRNGLTPVGTFKVQSKSPATVSNSDTSIGMKWMTRFNGGVGFHGIPVKAGRPLPTPLGQRPVSAGCIRMADDAAKWVYDRLPIGGTVVVAR